MKLSDAIRLGALLKPRITGYCQLWGRTCAVGAALDAIGELTDESDTFDAYAHWPVLATHREGVDCLDLLAEIVYRHDNRKQTREAIADWLDGLGIDLEQVTVRAPAVVSVLADQ